VKAGERASLGKKKMLKAGSCILFNFFGGLNPLTAAVKVRSEVNPPVQPVQPVPLPQLPLRIVM